MRLSNRIELMLFRLFFLLLWLLLLRLWLRLRLGLRRRLWMGRWRRRYPLRLRPWLLRRFVSWGFVLWCYVLRRRLRPRFRWRCHMLWLGLRRHRGFSRLGRLHARFSRLRWYCGLSRDGAGFAGHARLNCARANRGAAGLHLTRLATRLNLTRLAAGLHRTWLRSYAGLHLTGFGTWLYRSGLDLTGPPLDSRLHLARLGSGLAPWLDRRFDLTRQGRLHRLDLFVGRQLLNLGLLLWS